MKDNIDKNRDDLLGPFLSALQKNEPTLKDDQEIPDKVMLSIQSNQQNTSPEKVSRIRYLTYTQRWLTAASVCLLVLYGIEEYSVVQKMNMLEAHAASFNVQPSGTLYRQLAKNLLTVEALKERFPGRLKFLPEKQYLSQSQTNSSFKTLKP